jgi:hypothetical protein
MSGIILSLREYIFLSLKELPLIATVGPFFLGVAQGNINLLMFSLGIAIIAPLGAGLSGWALKFLLERVNSSGSLWKVPASDVSPLLPDVPMAATGVRGLVNVVPTYWMTMTVFFFSYLAINALTLYTQEPAKGADSEKVENRRAQAIMCLVLIVVLGLTIIGAKVWFSSGETALGLVVASLVGFATAQGWFAFLRRCGMGRLEDVFGIQARILPESSMGETPVVCV